MKEKKRLDVAVFEAGLTESREKARASVMAGIVYVNGVKEEKPGTQVSDGDNIEIRGTVNKYVSRGGLKLERAMESFPIKLDGCVCMDIGASTGGFTDCMLQNGASAVYAVDVGYGQLAWKLRCDERVIVMERTNIRSVEPEQIGRELDFCSVDVSFISLTLVLPVARRLLRDGGGIVCLIKPQFEAGRESVGKKGVVRDPAVHERVIEKIYTYMKENGFMVLGLDNSPVKGPEGNIEYLIYAVKSDDAQSSESFDIKGLVKHSHDVLD